MTAAPAAPTAAAPAPPAPAAAGPASAEIKPAPGAAESAGARIDPRIKLERPPQADAKPQPGVVLRFENADIQDIVQAVLGDILHVNYMMDPSIQAKVTLQSLGDISAADVYNLLESVLSLHGIAIVRDGKLYKVMRDAQANRDAIGVAAGEGSPVVQIVPLRFVQASALIGTVKAMLGPAALVVNDPTNRYLIVVDRAQNVSKLLELVGTLDVDYLARVSVKIVELRNGDAAQLAKEMESLFRTSGMFNVPGTEGNKVYFLPLPRMNAILVAAVNETVLAAAEKWLRTLDEDPKNGLATQVHVYPVANSTALHLANLLRQVYGGAASSAPTTPTAPTSTLGASATPSAPTSGLLNQPTQVVLRGGQGGAVDGNVQIIADETTNSLVIRASQNDYRQIRQILERIDTIPRQVLIQVMVAEVGLSKSLQYGVEWWLRNLKLKGNQPSRAAATFDSGLVAPVTVSSTNQTTVINPLISAPAGGIAGGLNYMIFNAAGDITGLFNLLATNTDVNILSAPHIMASDGKIARIEVGSEEPVVTQTVSAPITTTGATTSFSTSNSVSYRTTGILMEVKPTITSQGRVSLSLSQEVSALGANVSVGGSTYPSFTKRKISTDVVIEEGKTLVVAGLIQDNGNNSSQGLPGLKDIPIFGALFGTQNKASDKTELLIAITPYIVNNKEEGDRVSSNLRDSLQELKRQMATRSTVKGSPERFFQAGGKE